MLIVTFLNSHFTKNKGSICYNHVRLFTTKIPQDNSKHLSKNKKGPLAFEQSNQQLSEQLADSIDNGGSFYLKNQKYPCFRKCIRYTTENEKLLCQLQTTYRGNLTTLERKTTKTIVYSLQGLEEMSKLCQNVNGLIQDADRFKRFKEICSKLGLVVKQSEKLGMERRWSIEANYSLNTDNIKQKTTKIVSVPDEPVTNKSHPWSTDQKYQKWIEWLAGFIDGDGCFGKVNIKLTTLQITTEISDKPIYSKSRKFSKEVCILLEVSTQYVIASPSPKT